MKFYSEVLNNYYNTEKECVEAEKEYRKKAEKEKMLKEEKEKNLQREKKEAAKKVEDAEAALSEAYDRFKLEKQNAEELLAKAKAAYSETLEKAAADVKEKERKKLEAVKEFNDHFGVYSKIYTGEKASKEVARISDLLDGWFNYNTLRNFWW